MSRVSASVILIHDSATGEPMRIAPDSSLLLVGPEHERGLLFEASTSDSPTRPRG